MELIKDNLPIASLCFHSQESHMAIGLKLLPYPINSYARKDSIKLFILSTIKHRFLGWICFETKLKVQ